MLLGSTSREFVIPSNCGQVNRGTRSVSLSDINGGFHCVAKVSGDVVVTVRFVIDAERYTTFLHSHRAATPADWTNTVGIRLAGWVAKAGTDIILLIWLTSKSCAKSSAVIGVFDACKTEIGHAIRAFVRAI